VPVVSTLKPFESAGAAGARFAAMPLDPGTAALLELIANSGYPPMYEGTPEAARKAFRAMTCDWVTPESRIGAGEVQELTIMDRPARLYRPDGEGPWPTLVYFHGGGFVIGDLDTIDQTCRLISRDAEVAVLSVDYRLAPEHPFPAAVDDAIAAGQWAADHKGELGGGEVLAVGGDSAGANLAAVVAQTQPDAVDAQVLICPPTHMLGDYPSRTENAEGYFLELNTMAWFARNYAGGADDLDDPRLSPYLGVVAGVAPALVVTTEFDPLRDEGEAYAARLRDAGVPVESVRYDGLVHGFIDMAAISPAAESAMADTAARIGKLLHG
jgi:acetyl esterase